MSNGPLAERTLDKVVRAPERAPITETHRGSFMIRLAMTTAVAILAIGLQTVRATEVTETVTTTASPKTVWQVIGKFDSIAQWLPNVASSPADKGNKVGSVRVITLNAPGNPTVTEKLTARKGHSYSYEIEQVDPKVLPVTAYTSTISVAKAGAGSIVTWHGSFTPPSGVDDATSSKAVSGLYRSGLDNIKALAEK